MIGKWMKAYKHFYLNELLLLQMMFFCFTFVHFHFDSFQLPKFQLFQGELVHLEIMLVYFGAYVIANKSFEITFHSEEKLLWDNF